MTITFSELMQPGTFIVALVTLIHNWNKKKQPLPESILQDFDEKKIEECAKPLFYFAELDAQSTISGDDDFRLSLYKDLFFSEIYENYNVLTMANVYGLLTERCSHLPECKRISSDNEK